MVGQGGVGTAMGARGGGGRYEAKRAGWQDVEHKPGVERLCAGRKGASYRAREGLEGDLSDAEGGRGGGPTGHLRCIQDETSFHRGHCPHPTPHSPHHTFTCIGWDDCG